MKVIVILTLCFSIAIGSVSAQDVGKTPKWGLIFNADSLLSNLGSYQSGIGVKYSTGDNTALRILLDIFFSNSLSTYSGTLGITYENHIRPGKISPYWGGFIQGGYISQTTKLDSENWTKDDTIPVSGGLILGVEVFVLEYLSFFAEYGATFDGTIQYKTTDVAGAETKWNPQFNNNFDTGIGNDAKLGITIYLGPMGKKGGK